MLTDVVLPLKPWAVVTAVLIHCCLAVSQTPNYCARFEFPDLHDLSLTAPEGSLVNVSFRLVFDTTPTSPHPTTPTSNNDNNGKADDEEDIQCLDRQRIVLGISKESSKDNNHHERDCFLRVTTTNTGALCQSFTRHRCRCVAGGVTVGQGDAAAAAGGGGGGGVGRTLQFTLQLTQRVGKGDQGWWRWWTRDDVAPPASVFLVVYKKEPEDKEKDKNRHSSRAREVTEPQHPSSISPGITVGEAENITFPTTNHNNSSSDNNNNPNAEVDEGEKNKNDNGDDNDDDTKKEDASAMNVSYVAMIAGVNISTFIAIAIVVFVAWRVCCKHGRRSGGQRPRPCSLNTVLTEQRRRTMSSTAEYSKPSFENRVSTSSWIYDEIPDDATKTLITTESSLYLHPIECTTTTTTTTPATTTATNASAITSTTITLK